MLQTTLAGLRAHVGRLMMSATAIVLGVAFVTGTFTFGATVKAAFFDTFAAQTRHVDAAVRPSAAGKESRERPVIAFGTLRTVKAVPGVAATEGRLDASAPLLGSNGHVIVNGESPGDAVDVPADPRFRAFTLTAGRLPQSLNETLVDAGTATQQHFRIGDRLIALNAHQARTSLTLVGIMDISVDKQLSGSSVLALTGRGVRNLTAVRGYARIDIAATAGTSQTRLADEVRSRVSKADSVITGTTLTHDVADDVTHQVDLFTEALLMFGVVSLLVAALVIYNTFKILVAQRTRELALLCCVGASRRQIFGGVVVESVVVGFAGSAVGVAAGIGVAFGMTALTNGFGAHVPPSGIVFSAAYALIGLLAGTTVTAGAALLPAFVATRVPPVAALRELPGTAIGGIRLRLARIVIAAVLGAVGIMLAARGIPEGRTGLMTVAFGGCVFFLGVLTIGPLIVSPLVAVLGMIPARIGGVPVRLAITGARRSPGRTSTTMAALTIGVGLMTLFSVVLATAGRFGSQQITQHYPVDYIISPYGADATVPADVAAELRSEPQIATAGELRTSATGTAGIRIGAIDPTAYGTIYRPPLTAGNLTGLGDGETALYRATAKRLGTQVGRTVKLTTPKGVLIFIVKAIFNTNPFSGEQALISWADYTRAIGPGGDDEVFVLAHHGVSPASSRAAVDRVTANRPLLQVQSAAAYKAQLNTAINQVTTLLGALLATAIIIALFGIANTLSLSVIERTRELALLRALGLTRPQLRRALSAEAFLIALMGGLIGVAVGTAFGWAISRAFLHDSGGGEVVYPVGRTAIYLAVAALAGVVAAVVPGRRAARASIIDGLTSP